MTKQFPGRHSTDLMNSVSCPFCEGIEPKRTIVHIKSESQSVIVPASKCKVSVLVVLISEN